MTLEIFALVWFGVNLLAFLVYGFDKFAALNGLYRISEKQLLTLTLMGGIGAIAAIRIFRHKTRKQPFRTQADWAALGHLAATCALAYWLGTA